MHYTTRDIQIQCAAMGHNPGVIDGLNGSKTRLALKGALEEVGGQHPYDLFDPSGLHSIVMHWTAGANGVIELERRAYNAVVDAQSNVYDGVFRPEAQATYRVGHAASHTYMANTHRIGISVDCMAGARERPFHMGTNPIQKGHVEGMLRQTAQWIRDFNIIPSKWTVLTHAEVQPNLNIRQKWKWDIRVLPGDKAVRPADEAGDMLREQLQDYL